ncbi:hypothetical protein [Mycobacterium basiliense]|uniref:hypothetical protein n=1 Tax=Mycobacterium basiliense TaxID=2094119 RepID=UPI0013018109
MLSSQIDIDLQEYLLGVLTMFRGRTGAGGIFLNYTGAANDPVGLTVVVDVGHHMPVEPGLRIRPRASFASAPGRGPCVRDETFGSTGSSRPRAEFYLPRTQAGALAG